MNETSNIIRGKNLRGVKFKNENFAGQDFSGFDLRGANFDHCDLSGANFENAKIGVPPHWAILKSLVPFLLFLPFYIYFSSMNVQLFVDGPNSSELSAVVVGMVTTIVLFPIVLHFGCKGLAVTVLGFVSVCAILFFVPNITVLLTLFLVGVIGLLSVQVAFIERGILLSMLISTVFVAMHPISQYSADSPLGVLIFQIVWGLTTYFLIRRNDQRIAPLLALRKKWESWLGTRFTQCHGVDFA